MRCYHEMQHAVGFPKVLSHFLSVGGERNNSKPFMSYVWQRRPAGRSNWRQRPNFKIKETLKNPKPHNVIKVPIILCLQCDWINIMRTFEVDLNNICQIESINSKIQFVLSNFHPLVDPRSDGCKVVFSEC